MQITVRTLFASVIATAVLAGAVGALATAATATDDDRKHREECVLDLLGCGRSGPAVGL